MVQDQRMRNARCGGDLVKPQTFGAGTSDRRPRRVEDQPSRFVRGAADPFGRLGRRR